MMSKTSAKKYTKKQILESIKWWQKQLKAGNYKRLDESWSIECDPYNQDAVACFTQVYTPQNTGDESCLRVAPDMKSFAMYFAYTNGEPDDCILTYKGSTASYTNNKAQFIRILEMIRKDSVSSDDGNVEAEVAWKYGDEDNGSAYVTAFNFVEIPEIDTTHVIWCPKA